MPRSQPSSTGRSAGPRRGPARARSEAAAAAAEARSRKDAGGDLHPRSRHHGRYDLAALVAASPALARHVITTAHGDPSIDFADPAAVKALNAALLRTHYDIRGWDIPAGFLCPPIPGRADYLHHVADLLASCNGGRIPRGGRVVAFDVGTGASVIYPLIGHREYGWRFVGSDCDEAALASAKRIIAANPGFSEAITLVRQRSPQALFAGVAQEGDHFDVSLCNPPFHASAADAAAGSMRKWRHLGRPAAARGGRPVLNFGGREAELWCPGGEVGFISRMIAESRQRPSLCLWFTSLVSKEASVPPLVRALQAAHVRERRIIELAHGQKRSRILAWTFLDERARRDWRAARWG